MGIEPTSEAWEANLTQKTLDWRHLCDFGNALIGQSWKMAIRQLALVIADCEAHPLPAYVPSTEVEIETCSRAIA